MSHPVEVRGHGWWGEDLTPVLPSGPVQVQVCLSALRVCGSQIQGLCVESLLPCTRWWPDTSHSGRGGENNLPHSFFPKLWFRQQPLGVTVALASNDRQGQGRAGARAVGHVVLAAHLDPNRIVSELWLA